MFLHLLQEARGGRSYKKVSDVRIGGGGQDVSFC